MERTHIVIIAAVAVVGLFGLKLWSDRMADSGLDADSRGAEQRLARAGGHGGSSSDGSDWGGSGQGAGEPGSLRPGEGGHSGGTHSGTAGGASGHGASGSSADALRIASARLPGAVTSGSGRSAGSWGSASSDGSLPTGQNGAHGGGSAGPQKQALVDFLSSQQPTHQDLAVAKPDDGSDVALKLDKSSDIASQGGDAQNVKQNDDGISVPTDGVMQFPNNVSPDAATISFKFTPNWDGSDPTDNALLELHNDNDWSNRIEITKNGDFLRFIVTPSGGQEADISVRIDDWQAGTPHDIQANYGDGQMTLNVDGVQRGQNTLTSQLTFNSGTPLYVGSAPPNSNYVGANGTFTDFNISNSKPN